jgi:hypothetical protein
MFVDKYGLEIFKLPLQKMDTILKNTLENLPKIIELIDSQLPDEIKESFKPVLEIEGVENTPIGQIFETSIEDIHQVDDIPQVDNIPQGDDSPQVDNISEEDNIPEEDDIPQIDDSPQVDDSLQVDESLQVDDILEEEDVDVVAQDTTNIEYESSSLSELDSDQISTDEEYESDSTSEFKEAELVEGMNING